MIYCGEDGESFIRKKVKHNNDGSSNIINNTLQPLPYGNSDLRKNTL